jgi:hypothetical protein
MAGNSDVYSIQNDEETWRPVIYSIYSILLAQ